MSPRKLASKGNGSLLIDGDALDKFQRARHIAGQSFKINTAYRDEFHNAMIGGSPRSYHLEGKAFDISLANHDKESLLHILEYKKSDELRGASTQS